MARSEQASCHQPPHADDLLDHHPFDETERTVLEIARRFFTTFARPESQNWIAAFAAAERSFGCAGAGVAVRLAQVIQVLRASRTADFGFVNPDCPCCCGRITTEERYFLSILHALRRGRRSDAVLNAMFVCGGQDHDALVAATDRLRAALTGH